MEIPRLFLVPSTLARYVKDDGNKVSGLDSHVSLVPQHGIAIHAYKSLEIDEIKRYAQLMNVMYQVIDGGYILKSGEKAIVETMKVLKILPGDNSYYKSFTISTLANSGTRGILSAVDFRETVSNINNNLFTKIGSDYLRVEPPNCLNGQNKTVFVTDVANSVQDLLNNLY